LEPHQQNGVVDAVERGAEVEQRKQRDAWLVGGGEDICHDTQQRHLRRMVASVLCMQTVTAASDHCPSDSC